MTETSTARSGRPSLPGRLRATLGLAYATWPGAIGASIVLFWIAVAVLAPLLAPFDPLKVHMPIEPPGALSDDGRHFWLGTDVVGRDVLSRLIHGGRTVLVYATLATAAAYVVGATMGLMAGFHRGWADAILTRVADVVLAFPVIVLYIIVITLVGASTINVLLAVVAGSSPGIMRIVRALTLDIAEKEYVAAARTRGESSWRIMFREILPNARGPLIVDACLRIGYTTITIGVLGFLGLGLPPPTPDWGGMINQGRAMAVIAPHVVLAPAIAISSLVLGLNLLATGLRAASLDS